MVVYAFIIFSKQMTLIVQQQMSPLGAGCCVSTDVADILCIYFDSSHELITQHDFYNSIMYFVLTSLV